MTPPRGLVRPAIQGALCGLLLACAAWGWLKCRRPVDKCQVLPNGSVLHKWACQFDEMCPAPGGLVTRYGNCPDGGGCPPRSIP